MIKNHLMRAGLALAVTLAGLGLHAFATDRPPILLALKEAGETLDHELAERIEQRLHGDPGLLGAQFEVTVEAGVVTLSGTVPDAAAMKRALDLTAGVRGVREMHNGLEIAFETGALEAPASVVQLSSSETSSAPSSTESPSVTWIATTRPA